MTFHEAIVQALIIQSRGISVEVFAMQAHDRSNSSNYTEEAYAEKAQALYAISNEIQGIARSGVFQ